jgi:hypothetical protein
MIPGWTRALALAVSLTTLLTTACGDDITTGNSVLPGGLTEDIGITARDEVEAALGALTLPSTFDPLGTARAPTAYQTQCVTPSSPADSDGDGVPDDAIYYFAAPPCRFTGWRGGTLEFINQLRIQDPTPTQAGFGYEGTLTNFVTRFTSADGRLIYDVRRNGTRALSGSISSLVLITDIQLIRTFAGKSDAAVEQEWTLTYTPERSLQINTAIPGGTLDFAGTWTWTRATEHFELTVTTPTPLHYNDGCIDTVQRIDAGEMHLTGIFKDGEGNDLNGNVLVRWSECGREPTYGFVAAE